MTAPLRSIAALLLLAFSAAGIRAAELCVDDGRRRDCSTVDGPRFAVIATAAQRSFVWQSKPDRALAVGWLPANVSRIDLTTPAWRKLAVTIEGRDGDRWPQPAELTVRTSEREAVAEIDARSIVSLRTIYVPAETASLAITAEHHRPVERELTKSNSFGTVTLVPYPRVRGAVFDKTTHDPVAGAAIAAATGQVLATTGADGRFLLEVTDEWPGAIEVAAPARAVKRVPLPGAVADFDMGTIEVSTGGTVRVTVEREPPVDVHVLRERSAIATRRQVSGAIDFEHLEPGEYVVVVSGDGPLQHLAVPVTVSDAAIAEVTPVISPRTLRATVIVGSNRVPGATITLQPASGDWQGVVTTGEDGTYQGELWQTGELGAFVHAKTPAVTAVLHKEVLPSDETVDWEMKLSALRIEGVVTDAEGTPLASADIELETDYGGGGTMAAATTDAEGRFAFSTVRPGKHRATVRAGGYLRTTKAFSTMPDESVHRVDIRLERGRERSIAVIDPRGRPIANAAIADAAGGGVPLVRTDANGQATLLLRDGERKTVYVLPAEGSFATAELTAVADDREPARIVVVPGDATIVFRAGTSAGAPVRDVFVAIRFNGHLIPESARIAMMNISGIPMATGPDGRAVFQRFPAGLYEMWPYATRDELTAIVSGLVPAPVRLAAQPGDNRVDVTLEQVRSASAR